MTRTTHLLARTMLSLLCGGSLCATAALSGATTYAASVVTPRHAAPAVPSYRYVNVPQGIRAVNVPQALRGYNVPQGSRALGSRALGLPQNATQAQPATTSSP